MFYVLPEMYCEVAGGGGTHSARDANVFTTQKEERKNQSWVLSTINIQSRAFTIGTPGRHDRQVCGAATNSGGEGATQVPIFICILSLYSKPCKRETDKYFYAFIFSLFHVYLFICTGMGTDVLLSFENLISFHQACWYSKYKMQNVTIGLKERNEHQV